MYHNDPEYNEDIDREIRLDDKRLIDIFNLVLAHCSDKAAFAKRFIMALLHIRWLFDRYVIKKIYEGNHSSFPLYLYFYSHGFESRTIL